MFSENEKQYVWRSAEFLATFCENRLKSPKNSETEKIIHYSTHFFNSLLSPHPKSKLRRLEHVLQRHGSSSIRHGHELRRVLGRPVDRLLLLLGEKRRALRGQERRDGVGPDD